MKAPKRDCFKPNSTCLIDQYPMTATKAATGAVTKVDTKSRPLLTEAFTPRSEGIVKILQSPCVQARQKVMSIGTGSQDGIDRTMTRTAEKAQMSPRTGQHRLMSTVPPGSDVSSKPV